MLYCTNCKELISEDDLSTYKDAHGFNDGHYEEYDICPNCGQAEFENAHKCEICGEYFYDEENDLSRICPNCVEENMNYETLFNATQKNGQKEKVEINIFLAELFTASEIEEILAEYLKQTNVMLANYLKKIQISILINGVIGNVKIFLILMSTTAKILLLIIYRR